LLVTFGEKLRQLRDGCGMTQEQLAEKSGINLWTIRGYEQGRREPDWKNALHLAGALGVAVEAFAGCVDGAEPQKPAAKKSRGKRK
jgi:transcriptional regulator with XRE-family HTH domain